MDVKKQLLSALGDVSIDPSLSNCSVLLSSNDFNSSRFVVRSLEDWDYYPKAHLNPTPHLIRNTDDKGFYNLGKNRVLILDFDIYDSSGEVNGKFKGETFTPDELILALQDQDCPLPAWYVNSKTTGNFHMAWVLSTLQDRDSSKPIIKKIAQALGSDTQFTNSVSYNPLCQEADSHFWVEWCTSLPLLESYMDLLEFDSPFGGIYKSADSPRRAGLKQLLAKKSREAILKILPDLEDGMHRMFHINALVKRDIYRRYRGFVSMQEPTPTIPIEDLTAMVYHYGSLCKDPVQDARLDNLVEYWNPVVQGYYAKKKYDSVLSVWKKRKLFLELISPSLTRTYVLYSYREAITNFLLTGDVGILSDEMIERIESYDKRKTTKNVATMPLLFTVLDIKPEYFTKFKTQMLNAQKPSEGVSWEDFLFDMRMKYGEDPRTQYGHVAPSDLLSVAFSEYRYVRHTSRPPLPTRRDSYPNSQYSQKPQALTVPHSFDRERSTVVELGETLDKPP